MSVALTPGAILLERYRVEREIGRGGMGVVVAARHLELGEIVAIKVLSLEDGRPLEPEHRQRFMQEARAVARLKSPNVPTVVDVGTLPSGQPYLVMEFLEGTDLAALLASHGPIGVEHAVDYLLQACEGLATAHGSGIVHRDLKPANLFLTRGADGSSLVKILDFGISKVTDAGAGGASSRMTRTRMAMGTQLYMPPEQIRDARSVDARADQWSLGVTLFELLTGRFPFDDGDVASLAVKICVDPHTDARAFRHDLPAGLSGVIDRCLSKTPTGRYADVGALAVALAPFGGPEAARGAERAVRVLEQARRRTPPQHGLTPATSQAAVDALLPDDGEEAELTQVMDRAAVFRGAAPAGGVGVTAAPTAANAGTSTVFMPVATEPHAVRTTGTAGTMSPHSSPLPATPGPRKPTAGSSRKLALAAGALALSLGGLVATCALGRGGGHRTGASVLPIGSERVPVHVARAQLSRAYGDTDLPVPDGVTSSLLAKDACGGIDVVSALPRLRGKPRKDVEAERLLDGADQPEAERALRRGLVCGDGLRRAMREPRVTELSFTDGGKSYVVHLFRAGLKEVPAEWMPLKQDYAGLAGACLPKRRSGKKCEEQSPGLLHDDELWAYGTVAALDAFAIGYAAQKQEPGSNAETLSSLATLVDGTPDAISLLPRPERIPWDSLCARAAPGKAPEAFMSACLPDSIGSLVDVDDKLRGVVVQRRSLASAQAFGHTIVLLMKDVSAARDVERRVSSLVSQWRAHAAAHGEELTRALVAASSQGDRERFWASMGAVLPRAIQHLSVSRDGDVVRIGVEEPLSPTERATLGAAGESTERKALLDVVDALINERPLPEEPFIDFLGDDVGGYIAAARATAADCAAVRAHLEALEKSVDADDFGLLFKQKSRFEDARCVDLPFPAKARKCLVEARNVKTFAACKLPSSDQAEVPAEAPTPPIEP